MNLKAHGVPFERGATLFRDPDALTIFDQDHSIDEDRWITMGHDRSGALLVVSHTFREETEWTATIRLISARKATREKPKTTKGIRA